MSATDRPTGRVCGKNRPGRRCNRQVSHIGGHSWEAESEHLRHAHDLALRLAEAVLEMRQNGATKAEYDHMAELATEFQRVVGVKS